MFPLMEDFNSARDLWQEPEDDEDDDDDGDDDDIVARLVDNEDEDDVSIEGLVRGGVIVVMTFFAFVVFCSDTVEDVEGATVDVVVVVVVELGVTFLVLFTAVVDVAKMSG